MTRKTWSAVHSEVTLTIDDDAASNRAELYLQDDFDGKIADTFLSEDDLRSLTIFLMRHMLKVPQ